MVSPSSLNTCVGRLRSCCKPSSVGEGKTTSSAKNSSRMSFSVPFVLVQRWAILNSLPSALVCKQTPSMQSLKAYGRRIVRKIPKSVVARTETLLQSSTEREGVRRRAAYMTFYWFTLFVESFVNSDWLGLVVFFLTNEQDGEQRTFTVNFSDNSDLRRGFKVSLRDF